MPAVFFWFHFIKVVCCGECCRNAIEIFIKIRAHFSIKAKVTSFSLNSNNLNTREKYMDQKKIHRVFPGTRFIMNKQAPSSPSPKQPLRQTLVESKDATVYSHIKGFKEKVSCCLRGRPRPTISYKEGTKLN